MQKRAKNVFSENMPRRMTTDTTAFELTNKQTAENLLRFTKKTINNGLQKYRLL